MNSRSIAFSTKKQKILCGVRKILRVFQLKAFPVHYLPSLNIKNMISYTMCTGHGWARVL